MVLSLFMMAATAGDLPLDQSLALARSAISVCAAKGAPVSAAVVDADGIAIVILRGDGSKKPPVAAPRKAATAVRFQAPGSEMEPREASDPEFAALIKANPELNAHGGSLPIFKAGKLIGGLAVADIDHATADACAREALKANPVQ
ncbi:MULTISPECIES: heme-binding protein [Asticcacaulis]|uniref:GlcG/HbpS family heme-binding protein n=1 Tax=Asticcacaulis TaxID=76890 RepID=UPI001AE76F26|nr:MULTISPECIES: heme-binding protein [Asticcacaulis]MBP2161589.1 uncharacterized protein GlcG (DUF336 family) [Asticcacaulis solisilvae]MDR6802560.1 uncharacterized protein GlcG (DUF336 family) [Asticcacaulis sp. BE141]